MPLNKCLSISIMNTLSPSNNRPRRWKSITSCLDEDDFALLTEKLKITGFSSLNQFIHAWIKGEYPAYENNTQVEKLVQRIRDRGITDPFAGDFNPTFYRKISTEDILKDFYRKYIYKKHARDLVRYFERYSDVFFTKPHLLQPLSGHVRAWICDSMRRFAEYYDRKYQNPEVRMLIDEIIKRYEINKKMKIRDRIFVADGNFIEDSVRKVLQINGPMGLIAKFAFSGLRGEEITRAHDTQICDKLSGCECSNLHVLEKGKFVIVILNRIMGQKRSYFTIIPLSIWSQFRKLSKVSAMERKAVHTLLMSQTDGQIMLMHLRKFHYNVLCRSDLK